MASLSVLHILRTIKERGSVSRTDLQHLTGLSWGTITNTTRDLLNRNLIREEGALATKAGRKPVRLAINPNNHSLIGLDIAPTSVTCLALNLAGETLHEVRQEFSPNDRPTQVLDMAAEMVNAALAMPDLSQRMCLGVGVAVQGAVDVRAGVMKFAPRMPLWRDVAVRDHLQNRLQVSVRVEHDPNCLALAERWFGDASAADDALCISLGDGVGMGILINGEIFRGAQQFAGEFGHTTVNPIGPKCACGDNGCVESYCSIHAVIEHVASLPELQSAEIKKILAQRAPTVHELVSAARAGDPAVLQAFEQLGYYLGIGIANVVDLFNPNVVVLCGPLTAGQAFFDAALQTQLEKRAWRHSSRQVLISTLGPRAIAMGACGGVLQGVFETAALQAELQTA